MFKDATLFFSQDSVPTIAFVITTFDRISDMLLNKKLIDHKRPRLHPAVMSAMRLGSRTMERYHSKTDDSDMYCVPLSKIIPSPYFLPAMYAHCFVF